MDETEEEKVDLLAVRKSFEKDPRKVIEIEMNKDGIFSERTIYAMENTLNLSLLSPPEGPKLANEAEALFVLSKNGHILETVESDFIEGYISPMVYRSSSMKFPQVPIRPEVREDDQGYERRKWCPARYDHIYNQQHTRPLFQWVFACEQPCQNGIRQGRG